jgi:nucleoid DNA-binding protein
MNIKHLAHVISIETGFHIEAIRLIIDRLNSNIEERLLEGHEIRICCGVLRHIQHGPRKRYNVATRVVEERPGYNAVELEVSACFRKKYNARRKKPLTK